ncbi:MAG: hypothetical protein V9F04_16920 [Dermatophilaceae bacterium]
MYILIIVAIVVLLFQFRSQQLGRTSDTLTFDRLGRPQIQAGQMSRRIVIDDEHASRSTHRTMAAELESRKEPITAPLFEQLAGHGR